MGSTIMMPNKISETKRTNKGHLICFICCTCVCPILIYFLFHSIKNLFPILLLPCMQVAQNMSIHITMVLLPWPPIRVNGHPNFPFCIQSECVFSKCLWSNHWPCKNQCMHPPCNTILSLHELIHCFPLHIHIHFELREEPLKV